MSDFTSLRVIAASLALQHVDAQLREIERHRHAFADEAQRQQELTPLHERRLVLLDIINGAPL